MAKIIVCDVCKKENKLVETRNYLKVKGMPALRLDVCDKHNKEITGKYPRITPEYVQYVYDLQGINIDLETAKAMLKRRT